MTAKAISILKSEQAVAWSFFLCLLTPRFYLMLDAVADLVEQLRGQCSVKHQCSNKYEELGWGIHVAVCEDGLLVFVHGNQLHHRQEIANCYEADGNGREIDVLRAQATVQSQGD